MRTPSSQLNRLLEASIADKRLEPEFFRALLDARVFAHAPLADTTGRLRLIQFNAPDGELLLPFFSDMGKAKAAGRGRVRIVELSGRQLFELSLGATLILNPNNHWCKLYPEEVRVLLANGTMAVVETDDYAGGPKIAVDHPVDVPDALLATFRQILAKLHYVEEAYLVDMRLEPHLDHPNWVVAVTTSKAQADRACRAILAELQSQPELTTVPLSLMALLPEDPVPDWKLALDPAPFYRRTPSES